MNDFKRYLRIVKLIRDNRADQLSTNDYKFFRQFTLDDKALSDLRGSKDYKELPQEEKDLFDANLVAFQTPQFKQDVLLEGQDIEEKQLAGNITNGLNIALAAGDIFSSYNQIKEAGKEKNNLQRPTRPVPLTADPALNRAMADSQNGNLDAARALSPAQLQILDQYLSDIGLAKSVSGGQAGTYGALGQVASTRRGRRAQELGPMYDEISRRGDQRYDNLLGLKLQQNQAIQDSASKFYPHDLNQYNNQLTTANELGAAGRFNMRSSVGALGSFLPSVLSHLQTRKRFRNIYNQGLAYDENTAKVMAEADYNLYNPDTNDYRYADSMSDPSYYEQRYGIN